MTSPDDSDRFFNEQPIEEVRMEEANRELREIGYSKETE
jgi:hypothetical protein